MSFSRNARRVMRDAEKIVHRLLHTDATALGIAGEYGMKRPDAVLRVYRERTTKAQRRAAQLRKLSGPLNCMHVPVGTVRLYRVKGQAPARFIKVRDDGPENDRWEAYAVWLWRRDHGPVPPEHRVMHGDGNTLNDSPGNLVCVSRTEAIRLVKQNNPDAEARRIASIRRSAPLAAAARRAANDLRRQTNAAAFAGEEESGITRAELSRRTGFPRWMLSHMKMGRRLMSEADRIRVETAIRDYRNEKNPPPMPRGVKELARRRLSDFLSGLEVAA